MTNEPASMFLDCGREPEKPGECGRGRACKLKKAWPRINPEQAGEGPLNPVEGLSGRRWMTELFSLTMTAGVQTVGDGFKGHPQKSTLAHMLFSPYKNSTVLRAAVHFMLTGWYNVITKRLQPAPTDRQILSVRRKTYLMNRMFCNILLCLLSH